MQMDQVDFNNMIFAKLIQVQSELEAFKSMMIPDYIERNEMSEDEFQKIYDERVNKAKEVIIARIKVRYGNDFNVDDILTALIN